jgi:hypothetical protein
MRMLIEVRPAGTFQVQLPTVVNLSTTEDPLVVDVGVHGAATAGSMKTNDEKAKRAPISAIEALFSILRVYYLARNFNLIQANRFA